MAVMDEEQIAKELRKYPVGRQILAQGVADKDDERRRLGEKAADALARATALRKQVQPSLEKARAAAADAKCAHEAAVEACRAAEFDFLTRESVLIGERDVALRQLRALAQPCISRTRESVWSEWENRRQGPRAPVGAWYIGDALRAIYDELDRLPEDASPTAEIIAKVNTIRERCGLATWSEE